MRCRGASKVQRHRRRLRCAYARSIKGCLFVVVEHVHTGAPRLDFARGFGEFLLVFVGPTRNSIQNVFCGLAHARKHSIWRPLGEASAPLEGSLDGAATTAEKTAANKAIDGGRYRD